MSHTYSCVIFVVVVVRVVVRSCIVLALARHTYTHPVGGYKLCQIHRPRARTRMEEWWHGCTLNLHRMIGADSDQLGAFVILGGQCESDTKRLRRVRCCSAWHEGQDECRFQGKLRPLSVSDCIADGTTQQRLISTYQLSSARLYYDCRYTSRPVCGVERLSWCSVACIRRESRYLSWMVPVEVRPLIADATKVSES